MIKKIKYLLFLIVLSFIFIPKDTYAISISSGIAYPYVALGNQNVFPEYDSGYTHSHSHSINLKNSQDWYSLQGSQDENGYYTVIKKIRLEITSSETLQSGKEYKLVIATDYDAYITFSDFYGWRWSVDRNLTYCKVGNTDMASCSISWSPTNGTTHNGSNIVIRFTPNSSGSSFTIDIGTISGSQKFVAWNRYGGSQNFNMNFTSLDLEGSGGIDTGEIIANNNQNTQNIINNQNANQQQTNEGLSDINDSITDDTPPSTSDFEDFIDSIEGDTGSNPLGTLMTLPITFAIEMYSQFTTQIDDGCSRVKLMSFSGPWFDDSVDIYLPCFNGEQRFGSSWWHVIDLLICFTMFYNIVMLFVHVWQDISTLSLDTGASASRTGTPSNSPYGRR